MPRIPYPTASISEAEKRLDALADAGAYLRALDLMRLLEKSLLKCHEKRVPVQRIWMELSEGGIIFTRQHFSRAHRQFLEEKGLSPQRWRQSPQRPDLPPGKLPPDRPNRLPSSREITRAVKDLQQEAGKTSLDLITKDL